MPIEDVPVEYRRLLEAFGYHWNEELGTWKSADSGSAISQHTVAAWTVDQAREFLTREAAKR
jgi:hypothetical protein